MTVIAFDGRYVAADRCTTAANGIRSTTQKLVKWQGKVLTGCGHEGHIAAQVGWYRGGCVDTYPMGDDRNWATFYVFEYGKPALRFERSPFPGVVLSPRYAAGVGGPFALGAMYAGASAEQAVRLAGEHMDGCGMGLDVVDLQQLAREYADECRASSTAAAVAAGGTTSVAARAVQL